MGFGILVNTCDSFEDCWSAFFNLFNIYWPNYNGKIYLNTETKNFTYCGLNIKSLAVQKKANSTKKLSWSECLKVALRSIEEDIILYLQEDYFFKGNVQTDIIDLFVQVMIENPKIECIHLTDQAVQVTEESPYSHLHYIKEKQRYKISCQAALWRKDALLSYLLDHENGWQFEEFGSKRASFKKKVFLTVDPNWVKLNHFEVIPYIFTGIVQGKWLRQVVPLFEQHKIFIDYSKRGFNEERPSKTKLEKIKWRINYYRVALKSHYYLLKLKLNSSNG